MMDERKKRRLRAMVVWFVAVVVLATLACRFVLQLRELVGPGLTHPIVSTS
ncbi:MAG: hypothetical protein HY318_19925 [Armatimonadetes bacterium]|nr:hypothetical protein [Armatimonadota bacterium]